MYLSKFRLLNYKSFQDSKTLEFKPGVNIIVGANNSGKTALLEALSLNFLNNTHRSLTTVPSRSSRVINSHPGYQLSLTVQKETIIPFIRNLSELGNNTLITLPDEYEANGYCSQSLNDFFNNENLQDVEIQIRVRGSADVIPFDITPNFFSSFYNTPIESLLRYDFNLKRYQGVFTMGDGVNVESGLFPETIQYQFYQKYRSIIYKFNSERVNLATSPVGTSSVLNPDGSNLAQVLSILQANPSRFEIFNRYVSTIIPGITWISVPPHDNNTAQIKVWTLDRAEQREDLTYPLSDCGTGVSQILAILYVLITSEEPRIIIIDEPQSFLHPGAAKKLVGIFKEFRQHQYFIATHSPEIIAAANPSTIVKLQYENSQTQALTMSARDIREQRSLLAELGVSLSDVFGADNILWVEGPTEEECFSLILEKVNPQLLTVTKIISVNSTGDLLRKTKVHLAHVMFDLYSRISGGKSLYPPAVGFVFDKECLSDTDIEDLQRRTPHSLKFIERRMYENYLLHPEAIAFVLNQEIKLHQKIEEQKQFLTSEEVLKWLESNKKDYFSTAPTEKNLSNPQWVDKNIDGAKLLAALFANFPQAKVEFSKTTHSVRLTERLLENNPACFDELVQFLQGIIEAGKAMMFSGE